ncbi:MAG TPA: hypothetical protein VKT32_10455 [Chthonomonadaceae bacterium]|nr:hypothetical protein [Chthonomonadaceae bacterium]
MDKVSEFIEKMKSPDADVRYAAWRAAGPVGAPAIASLADLAASPDKGVAKSARGALQTIVHYAARPGARADAHAVSVELLKVAADSERPQSVRAEALHLIGFTADSRTVPGVARLLADAPVRDEARMALERIPGSAATGALRQAAQAAPGDFRPALQQSLHNRALTRKTAGLLEAGRS